MKQEDAVIQDTTSIFDEIEMQLDALLSEKKLKIQEELENKIEKEKQEAEEKISLIEKQLTEERDSLHSFRLTLAEYENDKKKIKEKIKEHLAKAMEYQPQIESLTAQTFDELKKVVELNKELEEITSRAMSRMDSLKQNFEEKYGIKPPFNETIENEDVEFNLDGELEKLKKIKELLGQNALEISDNDDGKHDLYSVTFPAEHEQDNLESVEESDAPEDELEAQEKDGPEDAEEMETAQEEKSLTEADTPDESDMTELRVEMEEAEVQTDGDSEVAQFDEVQEKSFEEKESAEEATPLEYEDSENEVEVKELEEELMKAEESSEEIETLRDTLDSYRKVKEGDKNINLTYFESGEEKFLDGQEIVDTITKTISEAEGLYEQLTGSDSPKEQFFSKQEILWHQETLREYIHEAIQMFEKEQASFPKFLDNVLNKGVLEDLNNSLSQENWSNAENFSSFKSQIEELSVNFLEKSTPTLSYLQTLIDELKQG